MKTISFFATAILILLSATDMQAQREVFTREKPDPIPENELLVILVEKGEVALSNEVLFQFDSTEFAKESAELQLAAIAKVMEDPKLRKSDFIIEGHTCDVGEQSYNQTLSEKRAEKVQKFLVKNGIKEKRLKSIGYGESRPLAENEINEKDDAKAREEKRRGDRRVVIRVEKS